MALATPWGSPTPQVTAEQAATFMPLAKSWLPRLLSLAQDKEGLFRPLCQRNGVTMSVGQEPGADTKLLLLHARTTFRVPHRILNDTLVMDNSERFSKIFREIDPMFTEGLVLWTEKGHTPDVPFFSLKWARYALPSLGILQDRDFLFLEYDDELEIDGQRVGLAVAQSVELEQYPPIANHVRAELMISGYVFRELEEGVIEGTYILQANPKGVLPAWAVNFSLREQGLNPGRMRDWLQGLETARMRMADLELVADVMQDHSTLTDKSLSRRETHTFEFATAPGQPVVFAFCALGGDVEFTVEGVEGSEYGKSRTYAAHKEPVHGQVVAAGSVVVFRWQNNHWVKNRQLFYTVHAPGGDNDNGAEDIDLANEKFAEPLAPPQNASLANARHLLEAAPAAAATPQKLPVGDSEIEPATPTASAASWLAPSPLNSTERKRKLERWPAPKVVGVDADGLLATAV